jgi:hypothetical protein
MPRAADAPVMTAAEIAAAVDPVVTDPGEQFVRAEDVRALIADALAKQSETFLSLLTEQRSASTSPSAPSDSDGSFARQLAMHIAQLTDQGTNRKRLPPEVLEARERAGDRMFDLIIQARADGRVPVYTLVHKVYLDELLIEPMWSGPDKVARATEIGWPGVPSLAMAPHNEVAREIYAAFEDSIGHVSPEFVPGPQKLTPGGVVIVSGYGPAPSAPQTSAPSLGEGVQIRGRGMPGAIMEKAVLGTVAPRARQNA